MAPAVDPTKTSGVYWLVVVELLAWFCHGSCWINRHWQGLAQLVCFNLKPVMMMFDVCAVI
jgi:hypothetical protein